MARLEKCNIEKINVSVLIPVYKCGDGLPLLVSELANCDKFKMNIILLIDGDEGSSCRQSENLSSRYANVTLIKLSKNYGQHAAIRKGLEYCSSPVCAIMDGDGQDGSDELIEMLELLQLEENRSIDYVIARRESRKDSYLKQLQGKVFYRVLSFVAGKRIRDDVGTFCVMRDYVKTSLIKNNKKIVFVPLALKEVGFRPLLHNIRRKERTSGKSSYTLQKLMRLGLVIVGQSSMRPLKIVSIFSLLMSLISFLAAITLLCFYLAGLVTLPGWMSIIITLLATASVIFFSLSIIALYVASIHKQMSVDETVFVIPNREKSWDI